MQKDAQTLEQIGHSYWGEHWVNPMAQALSMREDQLRKIMAGKAPLPDGCWAELLAIGRARAGDITVATQELSEMLRPAGAGSSRS